MFAASGPKNKSMVVPNSAKLTSPMIGLIHEALKEKLKNHNPLVQSQAAANKKRLSLKKKPGKKKKSLKKLDLPQIQEDVMEDLETARK